MSEKLIPLFHGTNSFFQEAIEKNGLGEASLIRKIDVPKYLRDALADLGKRLNFDSTLPFGQYPLQLCGVQDLYIIYQAAHQTVNTFNFRHENLYLTTSVFRARNYAKSAPEIFRFGFVMHDLVEKYEAASSTKNSAFHNFIASHRESIEQGKPLVYQVTAYEETDLFSEHGGKVAIGQSDIKKWLTMQSSVEFEYRGIIRPEFLVRVS
jgi:hypothetical protein